MLQLSYVVANYALENCMSPSTMSLAKKRLRHTFPPITVISIVWVSISLFQDQESSCSSFFRFTECSSSSCHSGDSLRMSGKKKKNIWSKGARCLFHSWIIRLIKVSSPSLHSFLVSQCKDRMKMSWRCSGKMEIILLTRCEWRRRLLKTMEVAEREREKNERKNPN